jgi:hypothetical protein
MIPAGAPVDRVLRFFANNATDDAKCDPSACVFEGLIQPDLATIPTVKPSDPAHITQSPRGLVFGESVVRFPLPRLPFPAKGP